MKVRTYKISGQQNNEPVVKYIRSTAKKAQAVVAELNAAGAIVTMCKVTRRELNSLTGGQD